MTTAIPLSDPRRGFIKNRAAIEKAWSSVLDAGIYIGGPSVSDFEASLAAFCGTKDCVAVANGTDALELALRAAGVKAGDEVITVANAGGYTTTACLALGAVPVYVDVDPVTAQLDLSRALAGVTGLTRAIVVTHLYGFMSDARPLRERLVAVGRSDIVLVEDCAQAHGARIGAARAGSLGDVGTFSFYPTKNLGAVGDAGAVATSSPEIADRLRQLRQYGWQSKYTTVRVGGRNSRMDPLQAAVLSHFLLSLDEANETRRAICATYRARLAPGWSLIGDESAAFVGHLAVIVAPGSDARDELRSVLSREGIGTDIHYPHLDCDQPGWKGLGRVADGLKASWDLTGRILTVPCFPDMTSEEVSRVAETLNELQPCPA